MSHEIITIKTINTDIINVATTEVVTIQGVGLQGDSGDNVGVASFNGRVGIVFPELDDYQASLITNDSTEEGATVKDSLDALDIEQQEQDDAIQANTDAINNLPSTFVESFKGRTGAVSPALDDYQTSLITNDSTQTGATSKEAFDNLRTEQDTQNADIIAIEEAGVFKSPVSPFPINYLWLGRQAELDNVSPRLDDTLYFVNNDLISPTDIIFTVDTTQAGSASDTFVFPMTVVPDNPMTISWGDGSSDVIDTLAQPELTHVYSSGGTYQITIIGADGMEFAFNNTGDKLKFMPLSQWGVSLPVTTSFYGCSNLSITATDLPSSGLITNFSSAWNLCSSLSSFPLIDTSSGTLFNNTWRECSSLSSFPLIDTSAGINFSNAWFGCTSLPNFPLIDTSSGTNLSSAWESCSSLSSFPLIDTSAGTSFINTWRGCSSLSSFPLIDVSSGISFINTWLNCALNSDSIDNIMQSLVNGGKSGLSTTVAGGTSLGFASWSAGAIANYNILVGTRGWTITTNP